MLSSIKGIWCIPKAHNQRLLISSGFVVVVVVVQDLILFYIVSKE